MIKGIPNQPIDFVGDDLITCSPETPSPLLVSNDDAFIFQFILGRCDDAEQYIASPDFTENWTRTGNWVRVGGNLCIGPGEGGASLVETEFETVPGSAYEVEIVVDSVEGAGIRIVIAGVEVFIDSAGTHVFTVLSYLTSPLRIFVTDGASSICLSSVRVYEGNIGATMSVVDEEGNAIYTTSITDTPEYFSIVGDTVVAIVPVAATEATGCFKLHLDDECSHLCSQTIRLVDDCVNTTKIRVCNDHDQPGMGFVAGRFEMRLPMEVILPTYRYDSDEERLTNGYVNRHRIDRQSERELRVTDTHLGYSAHQFISSISMFDHFYIGEREYTVDVQDYQPAYAEGSTSTGAVKLVIRPQAELFRKVLCEPIGNGCNPINDPICPTPNVVFNGSFDEAGLYTYNVAISSMVGFVSEELVVTVNGVVQEPIPFDTAPMDVNIGAYLPGSTIGIEVTNAIDPRCNWSTTLMVPCDCTVSPLVMWLGLTDSPSPVFVNAQGVEGEYDGYINGRPSWSINRGEPGGGIGIEFNGTRWTAREADGSGYVSSTDDVPMNPCEVSRWYRSVDGINALNEEPISFCGGILPTIDCSGPGYITVTIGESMQFFYPDGYYTYRRQSDGSVHTMLSDVLPEEIAGPDTLCIWPSDENGDATDDARSHLLMIGDSSDLDLAWLAEISFSGPGSILQIEQTLETAITIPAINGLGILYLVGSALETVELPTSNEYVEIVIGDVLSEAVVNAILANLRAVREGGYTGLTTVNLAMGTNAAPTGQGLIDRSWLLAEGVYVYTN